MRFHADRLIEAYFGRTIENTRDRDSLFGHLDRCPRCRATFDRNAHAHRALAGVPNRSSPPLPATELDLILPSVFDAIVERPAPTRWRLPLVLAPLAAVVLAFVLLAPDREARWVAKGGTAPAIAVELLCFDTNAEVIAHHGGDGTCPAPGFVKIVFASPRSTPHLTVVGTVGDDVRLFVQLANPEPRQVLEGHAPLTPGETLRVFVASGDKAISLDEATKGTPVIAVRGIQR